MTIQFDPKKGGGRGIEWTGKTTNPVGGCEHDCQWEIDGQLVECYAKTAAERGVARFAYPQGFVHHYWRSNALKELAAGKEPELIFVDSMSDLFGAWVPRDQRSQVLAAMRGAPHHTYQSLTKAAGVLRTCVEELPPNLWVGVSSAPDWFKGKHWSAEQQERYMAHALDVLAEIRERTGNIVWMSLEPVSWDMAYLFDGHQLDWVVIGAASSGQRKYQPAYESIKKLLRVFDATNTPVFYKGNIAALIDAHPDLGRWREDFPVTYRDGRLIPAVLRRQAQARQYGWTLNTHLTDLHELQARLELAQLFLLW